MRRVVTDNIPAFLDEQTEARLAGMTHKDFAKHLQNAGIPKHTTRFEDYEMAKSATFNGMMARDKNLYAKLVKWMCDYTRI